jgi:hypothetical protein
MLLKRLARCCCEMSASASRRDNSDRSLARSAWQSALEEPSRRARYDRGSESQSYFSSTCAPCFSFGFPIRNFVTAIIESVGTPVRIRPYPTGRLFWVALSQALRARLRSHRPSGTFKPLPFRGVFHSATPELRQLHNS